MTYTFRAGPDRTIQGDLQPPVAQLLVQLFGEMIELLGPDEPPAAPASTDPLAVELWEETIDVLATAITDLVNVFEPDLVVLGGGVTRSGDALIVPVRERVAAAAMPPAAAASTVVVAALGDEVCVVGAGAVAFDHLDRLTPATLTTEPHHV